MRLLEVHKALRFIVCCDIGFAHAQEHARNYIPGCILSVVHRFTVFSMLCTVYVLLFTVLSPLRHVLPIHKSMNIHIKLALMLLHMHKSTVARERFAVQ